MLTRVAVVAVRRSGRLGQQGCKLLSTTVLGSTQAAPGHGWAGEWGDAAAGEQGWVGSMISPPSRTLLELKGLDTVELLQAVVTADVHAWCDHGSRTPINTGSCDTSREPNSAAPAPSIYTFFLDPKVSLDPRDQPGNPHIRLPHLPCGRSTAYLQLLPAWLRPHDFWWLTWMLVAGTRAS